MSNGLANGGGYSLGEHAAIGGRHGGSSMLAADHVMPTVRKQRDEWGLTYLVLLIRCRTSAQGMLHLTCGMMNPHIFPELCLLGNSRSCQVDTEDQPSSLSLLLRAAGLLRDDRGGCAYHMACTLIFPCSSSLQSQSLTGPSLGCSQGGCKD